MIKFEVRDRLFPGYSSRNARAGTRKPTEWATVERTGQRWQDPDSRATFELFRIGVMAEALDRTPVVLKRWEKAKDLLPPLFRPQGEKCKHWYTGTQIINCHRLMRYRYRGKKWMHEKEEFARFMADMKRVWYMERVVVREDGLIVGYDKGAEDVEAD